VCFEIKQALLCQSQVSNVAAHSLKTDPAKRLDYWNTGLLEYWTLWFTNEESETVHKC
jgi:hypothetical protein